MGESQQEEGMTEGQAREIKALLELREQHRRGCSDRTSNGWKLNLGLWSALGLLAAGLASREPRQLELEPCAKLMLTLILMILLVPHTFWAYVLGKRNEEEARKVRCLGTEIESKIGGKRGKCATGEKSRWLWTYHSQILQIAITVCLAGLILTLVWGTSAK